MERDLLAQMGQQFIRESILSDDFLDFIQNNTKPMDELMAFYRCAIMEVETKFKVLNEQYSLEYDRNPIESIKTRVKSQQSILRKVKKKNIDLSLDSIQENIRDIAGVRIVCSFQDDIYTLAECLLAQDDIVLVERKDYIKSPKESGYRSLHLIIKVPIFLKNEKKDMFVEVQLRTIAMDFWASLEHKLRYKKHIPEKEAAQLASELLECAEESAALDRRMEEIRNRIVAAEGTEANVDKNKKLLMQNIFSLEKWL